MYVMVINDTPPTYTHVFTPKLITVVVPNKPMASNIKVNIYVNLPEIRYATVNTYYSITISLESSWA